MGNNKYEGRVRESSSHKVNQSLDWQTLENIRHYGYNSTEQIDDRIKQLAREWDIERVLEVNASALALSGVLLGSFKDKRWFILSGVVTSFLLQHGLQGWCPPLPVLRRLGFRTRKEIHEEAIALKALRGDFNRVLAVTTPDGVLNVVRD